jgi:crotonobetainyl-CoA:carnitine CoA-transferase CaiB-like acyl-CoA transferase
MGKSGLSTVKTTVGKESICVNLNVPEGRHIARGLIERADILIHNYRPGVPERLGMGYGDVSEYNPRLVYVSCTGYAEQGPYAHRPSARPTASAAMGGALWQAGNAMPSNGIDDVEEVKEIERRFYRANELNPDATPL